MGVIVFAPIISGGMALESGIRRGMRWELIGDALLFYTFSMPVVLAGAFVFNMALLGIPKKWAPRRKSS